MDDAAERSEACEDQAGKGKLGSEGEKRGRAKKGPRKGNERVIPVPAEVGPRVSEDGDGSSPSRTWSISSDLYGRGGWHVDETLDVGCREGVRGGARGREGRHRLSTEVRCRGR